jgi:hypothetical protein
MQATPMITNSSLVSINVLNGLDGLLGSDIQYIGQIGYGQVGALTFVDDILYGASDFHDSLFSIDLGTGFGVFMDNWGASIEGIAGVYPGTITAVPETWNLNIARIRVLGLLALCKNGSDNLTRQKKTRQKAHGLSAAFFLFLTDLIYPFMLT